MNRTAIESLSAVQSPPKSYCMQHQGFVDADKMTTLHTGKVVRRVCEACKSAAIDIRDRKA